MNRILSEQVALDEEQERLPLHLRLTELLTPICIRISMPKLMTMRMIQVMANQSRFVPDKRKRFSKRGFVAQETFPETLALHEIGLRVDGENPERLEPWNALRREVEAQRPDSIITKKTSAKKPERSRRRQVKASAEKPIEMTIPDEPATETAGEDVEIKRSRPPRKRSRRRKPSSAPRT